MQKAPLEESNCITLSCDPFSLSIEDEGTFHPVHDKESYRSMTIEGKREREM